jgi:hypothetical protein
MCHHYRLLATTTIEEPHHEPDQGTGRDEGPCPGGEGGAPQSGMFDRAE